jgi:hypothetical protein
MNKVMNTKKTQGMTAPARYVFLLPTVVLQLSVFTVSYAAISKQSAIINDVLKPVPAVIVAVNADNTGISANCKMTSTINEADPANTDSLNYVLNGKKIGRAEFSNLDPAKIFYLNIITAVEAKNLLTPKDDLTFNNDYAIVFVTTEGDEARKKMTARFGKEQISRFMRIVYGAGAGGNGLKTVYNPAAAKDE